MTNSEIINKTAEMIESRFKEESSGHDWFHILRVWRLAKTIAEQEKVDVMIVELAALLHDIADYKFHDGDERVGGHQAREWLRSLGAPENIISAVRHIVDNVSFKGGHEHNKMESFEGKVVQDADRLDSMGAIGIARAFAYGGARGRLIYDPDVPAKPGQSKHEYMHGNSPSINHFYEKLLKLKDLMNTDTGRKLAQQRHEYMQYYLQQFYAEWEGVS